MAKKKVIEIRIVNPSKLVLNNVARLANENKRSVGKQAEFMLETIIKKDEANTIKSGE